MPGRESQRRSREAKTFADKQDYWAARVKLDRKPTPTIGEQSNEFDSTETPLPDNSEATAQYQFTKRPKRKWPWVREHWFGLVASTVVAIVLGLGGWILSQLYSLNREVGGFQTQVGATAKQQDQLRQDFLRFEDQVQHEMDRMDDRLDHVPKTGR